MMRLFSTVFAVVLVVFAARALAQPVPEKFSLDKGHTYVGFEAGYFILLRVTGRFDDFQGSFVIDRNRPENNSASIIIETASVNTGVKTRDEDIRGPDLFNADRYPTMTFHSKAIELGPDNEGRILGDLTLLGVTKPVTLDLVRVPKIKDGEVGEAKVFSDGFIVTGVIRRSDFGMNAFVAPISDTVTLLVCYKVACDSGHTRKTPTYNQ